MIYLPTNYKEPDSRILAAIRATYSMQGTTMNFTCTHNTMTTMCLAGDG